MQTNVYKPCAEEIPRLVEDVACSLPLLMLRVLVSKRNLRFKRERMGNVIELKKEKEKLTAKRKGEVFKKYLQNLTRSQLDFEAEFLLERETLCKRTIERAAMLMEEISSRVNNPGASLRIHKLASSLKEKSNHLL